MNPSAAHRAAEQSDSIDLASAAPSQVGALELRPPTREVRDPAGVLHVIEPRVMQVLVALADAKGAVVSRDGLVARCWSGRAIGDDAINRAVAKARQVAELASPAAFAIESIPRVGYRLLVRDPAPLWTARTIEAPKKRAPHGPSSRRPLLLVSLAALAIGAAALVGYRQIVKSRADPFAVEVAPFESTARDPELGQLGRDIRADILSALSESRGPSGRDLVVHGDVDRDADRVEARISLKQRASGEILWSSQLRRAWRDRAQLRQELAATAVDAVRAAGEASLQPGLKVDPVALSLFIRGELLFSHPAVTREGSAPALFAEAVRRAPDFVAARGANAIMLMNACDLATAERRGCDAAQAEAERAIATNASSAASAFDTLFQLATRQQPPELAAAERIAHKGWAAEPSFPFLPMHLCIFLADAGKADEALSYCWAALALRPLGTPINLRLAQALWTADQVGLSEQVYSEASRRAPDYEPLRRGLTEIAVFSRPVEEAAAILDDPTRRSPTLTDEVLAAMRLVLRARASGRPGDIDAALRALANAEQDPAKSARYQVLAAGLFNRPDAAFAGGASAPALIAAKRDFMPAPALFLPMTEPLRHDPRFWTLAVDRGLVRYWRTNGWPDFCRKPAFAAECRARLGAPPT